MTFVTGSTALIIDRDVLKEKCDRLTRELEEAKAENTRWSSAYTALHHDTKNLPADLARMRRELEAARDELARLRAIRTGALQAGIGGNLCIEGVSDSFIAAIPGELLAQLKMVRADLARMRPVVEAAIAWLNAPIGQEIYRTQAALREATKAYEATVEKEGK